MIVRVHGDQVVTCGSCRQFEPIYPHGRGPGFCLAGVMPSGVLFWSETERVCGEWEGLD